MSIELKIPEVGESVREVQIGRWLKHEGDAVAQDENVVELETDKASMELPAPAAGVLGKILKREGDMVAVGDVIGYLEKQTEITSANPPTPDQHAQKVAQEIVPAPSAPRSELKTGDPEESNVTGGSVSGPVHSGDDSHTNRNDLPTTPAARRALREYGLNAADIETKGATLSTEDVMRHVEQQ